MRLIEFLFPCQCVVCSKVGEYICPKCIKGIPHCLPICCVCNKLSNKGLTHSFCSNINITYFTGWYISEKMSKIFDQKKEKGNFNIHLRLFTTLINYLKIYDLMCNKGNVKLAYSQNENETTTDTVNISKGM